MGTSELLNKICKWCDVWLTKHQPTKSRGIRRTKRAGTIAGHFIQHLQQIGQEQHAANENRDAHHEAYRMKDESDDDERDDNGEDQCSVHP